MRLDLEILHGPMNGRILSFTRPDILLGGRHSICHIRLGNDVYASKRHFLLLIEPPHCKLIDLQSNNGTYVNKLRFGAANKELAFDTAQAPGEANETQLIHGDRITIGATVIEVRTKICRVCGCLVPDGVGQSWNDGPDEYLCPGCRKTLGTVVPSDTPRVRADDDTIDSTPALAMRRSLDQFELLSRIAVGGQGEVWRARDRRSGETVAIKKLNVNSAVDGRRFMREMEMLCRVSHPNVNRFLSYGINGSTYFLALEFVEGKDLSRMLADHGGKLPLASAAPLMLQILEGLSEIHAAGIVHRDLKPENVLLERDAAGWRVKIADFGLSKGFDDAGMTLGSMTHDGSIGGTPQYMPREQLTFYRYLSPTSDVFSAAAIFFKMLTGRYARPDLQLAHERALAKKEMISQYEAVFVIVNGNVDKLAKLMPALHPEVAAVLDRALEEPAELPSAVPGDTFAEEARQAMAVLGQERYPDATAFKAALEEALRTAGVG